VEDETLAVHEVDLPSGGGRRELARVVWDWALESPGLHGWGRGYEPGETPEAEEELLGDILEVSWEIRDTMARPGGGIKGSRRMMVWSSR